MHPWPLVCLLSCGLLAQVRSRETPRTQTASIEGQVLNDLDERPLRRAQVVLRPMEAGLTTIGADADDKGSFIVRNVTPGRYSLSAQRDGYLGSATCMRGALRMPSVFVIESGQRIANLTFRLRPWAVLAGRIKFDDGEPAIGVRVDAYQEFRARGRHGYHVTGSAHTNDRGEFRMHGLPPGSYTVAAVYEEAPPAQGYEKQVRVDAEGRELAIMAYTTTFYPNTVKFSEAVPVQLEYGQEAGGIDLFLRLVHKLKIRGQVTNGVSGMRVNNAAIVLQRMDGHNTATLPAPVRINFDREGRFEIRDVTPGPYLITAEGADSGKRLIGSAALTVADADVENLELVISPERILSARMRIDGDGRLDYRISLSVALEPRSERGASVNADVRNMGFQCPVMSGETYDLYVRNPPDDFYVSAVRVNGSDAMQLGLEGSLAAGPDKPLEVVLDSRGGRVAGRAFGPDGAVWSGASVALIPDPPQGRLQAYRENSADEYGQFQIRGVPPGKYILVAWLDERPCDYYDPDGLDACRAVGMPITVSQSAQENVMLQIRPARR